MVVIRKKISKRPGYMVQTRSGDTGRTYHDEKTIHDKIQVFLDDGRKILCYKNNLKIIGFID